MTRILIVETASPKRVCHTALQIRNSGIISDPEISILCRESNARAFQSLTGVQCLPIKSDANSRLSTEFGPGNFDVIYAFWTGEKKYHRMKLLALRLRAKETRIIAGDGNEFRLTWKAIIRHAIFRWRHPLPTDHRDFVSLQEEFTKSRKHRFSDEEQILIIQSAEPPYVLRALERLRATPLFTNPRYTLFCRNRKEIVDSFSGHPMLSRILTHNEAQDSWRHLRELRRQNYDAIILLLTGDPSYRKIKLFAPLLGVPLKHLLIFNESADCFFFTWSQLGALISHRMRSRAEKERGSHSSHVLLSLVLKSVVLPFRFVWLLLVWLRLRSAGLIFSRKSHDDSLRLPSFPGT
jgi:hypothetical protein